MSLESVRKEVKFATTCQPGQDGPAIDGDAYSIVKLSHFARNVPPSWLDGIHTELYNEHNLGKHDEGHDEEGDQEELIGGNATGAG